jgi:NAD(P)-dependent dehydrogenase (short-subunit alcohol dehydrogenase family)
MIPAVKAKLLEGKRGLVVGIANEHSIAWGCAKAFRAFGAEIAVTYLNEKARKFVEPLAQALDAQIIMPLDVRVAGEMEAVFERVADQWGVLDFVVHSIAFSPKEALSGSRDGCCERRLSNNDGRLVLDIYPHGAFGGATYAQRWHTFHDVLLWRPEGRRELQHHGRR